MIERMSHLAFDKVSNKSAGSSRRTSVQFPPQTQRQSLYQFNRRNSEEPGGDYRYESLISGVDSHIKYTPEDSPDLPSREPSYSKFRIPYKLICSTRFSKSIKAYEAQFKKEINNLINSQRCAADACYLVRCMARTTFWPPLHNRREISHMKKNFFQISKKDRRRLNDIMNTDVI